MISQTVVRTPEELREACDEARAKGLRVGFVPTMGALHDGHLALVRRARELAGFVVVSIFVNPTQFGPNEDLSRYPRDLDGDRAKLATAGTDIVFAPPPDAIYPAGEEARVHVGITSSSLCGPFRPGHFEGVTTVVAKLFNLVGPCVAVFGRKDFQQLAVLRRMTNDLFFPVELVGLRTVREPDGLAMSSRNAFLDTADRRRALAIARGLAAASRAFSSGERRAGALRAELTSELAKAALAVEYADVADPDTLAVFADGAFVGERALLATACRVGPTRLIDNIVLGEDPPPPVAVEAALG